MGAVEWFQEPDAYQEGYSSAAALSGASARPGSATGQRLAGLATYGVPSLAQGPSGIEALPGPGASSSWVAAHQLPGYGQPYGIGASGLPVGARPASTSASPAVPAPPGPPVAQTGATTGVDAAFAWVLAWVVVVVLGILAIRTQLGYRLVYYGLALALLFLLLTNYQWLAAALSPITQGAQQPGGLLA